jgi:hypothetical protein
VASNEESRLRRPRCAVRAAVARPRRVGGARSLALCVLVWLLGAGGAAAEDDAKKSPLDEYQVKAAFLYRLPSFIEWPDEAWPADGDPFYACVLGRDPFGEYIDHFDGKQVRGRRFTVRRLESLAPRNTCHLIFVSRDESEKLRAESRDTSRRFALTVGEGREFAARGGIISFVVANKRVGLTVNLSASNSAGLRLSSKLLDVASVLEETK